ncbi:MAG: DMT family transporter [Burkholderiales bacterium]|nr:DMT family transporter [Burkholderiales bacterium]
MPRAALWMAGWLSLMVVLAIVGRGVTRQLPVFQVMEVRSLLGLLMLAPLVHAAGGFGALRTAFIGRHITRNVVHYAAQYGWFAALTLIPLAQLISIEFTMPLWTALLAAAFLAERLTTRKVLAVAVGLIGVAVIVRPTAGAVEPGQLIALVAAGGFAVSVVLVKSLTRTDSAVAIIFWMLVIQSVIGFLPALWTWQWPTPATWAGLVVIAFCGTFSHYCMTRAMRHADATVVIPMDFLRVPLTALAAWLVYAEAVDGWTVLGAALILGANALNLLRKPAAAGAGQAATR